jgi:hypothetical protein
MPPTVAIRATFDLLRRPPMGDSAAFPAYIRWRCARPCTEWPRRYWSKPRLRGPSGRLITG